PKLVNDVGVKGPSVSDNPGSLNRGQRVGDRIARKLNRRNRALHRVLVVKAESCEKLLLGGEIVVYSGGIGINGVWRRGVEKKPAGIDAIAGRQVVGQRVSSVE